MKKLYVHMGAGKTGSSALQTGLVRNRNKLGLQGINYPSFDSDESAKNGKVTSGNGKYFLDLVCEAYRSQEFNYDQTFEFLLNQINEIDDAESVIISNEMICGGSEELLLKLKKLLQEKSIEIYPIYFVRNLFDHAASLYGQKVKRNALSESFSTFLLNFEPPFYKQVNKLKRLFGSNLNVLSYDLHKDNILEATLQCVQGYGKGSIQPVKEKINRSLSFPELEVLRQINSNCNSPKFSWMISDYWIYRYPNEKSGSPQISETDYKDFVSKNYNQIRELNKFFFDGLDILKVGQLSGDASHQESVFDVNQLLIKTISGLMYEKYSNEFEEQLNKNFSVAREAKIKGDIVKAKKMFSDISRGHPKHIPTLYNLALIAESEGKINIAIDYCKQIFEIGCSRSDIKEYYKKISNKN